MNLHEWKPRYQPQDTLPSIWDKDEGLVKACYAFQLAWIHSDSLSTIQMGPDMPMECASSRPPDDSAWDTLGEIARRHYYLKPMSLQRVRREMKNRFGFRASESMYKTKFAEWGWAKNKSRRTHRKILSVPKIPGVLGHPENILRSIRYYVLGSFESGNWIWNDLGEYQRHSGTSSRFFEEFKRTIQLALKIDSTCKQTGSQSLYNFYVPILNNASGLLSEAIREEHPLMVIQMFAIMGELSLRYTGMLCRFLLCLRYWTKYYNFGNLHPLEVIFHEMVEFFKENNCEAAAIRSSVPHFCEAVVDSFVDGSHGYKFSVNPFLVEYLTQTKVYKPEIRDRLLEDFPRLHRSYVGNPKTSTHEALQLLYWWLKFIDNYPVDSTDKFAKGAQRWKESKVSEILQNLHQQCEVHDKDHSCERCWLSERGYYTIYEIEAARKEKDGQFKSARKHWELAIKHRLKYDQIQGRLHSSGTIIRMLDLYNRFIKKGILGEMNTFQNELFQYLKAYI